MSSSSSYISTSTYVAIISTSLLIYTQWKTLPEWMKLGLGGDSKKDGETSKGDDLWSDANDDLANPTAVMAKLKQMMDLVATVDDEVAAAAAKERGVSEDKAPEKRVAPLGELQLMAAFYSLIHLNKELLAKDPDYRDKLYEHDRANDDVDVSTMKELAEYLEYAHWAYECSHATLNINCRQAGLDLITHDTATEPGRVGHFIALHHSKKLAIIGLKGTSSFSDVLTDLIALPKKHVGCYFDDETFAAPKTEAEAQDITNDTYCHEGIFTAAIWMADSIQPMIENLLIPMGYKVVICGHSLGAGSACLLGLELRSRIADFRKNYTDLRVMAFATPPVISYKAAKACAPFVTSVINNCDVVTRSSVANLNTMYKLLAKVNGKLNDRGISLNSWKSVQKYYYEHSEVDDDLLMSEQELEEFFQETHADPEKDNQTLYVPGRIVVMWDKGENDDNAVGGIKTDPSMKMLRQVELSLSFITDHFVKGYRTNIHKLIDQLESTI